MSDHCKVFSVILVSYALIQWLEQLLWRLGWTIMELMVEQYFHAGFTYKEIIAILERCHIKKVSLRTLYRLLRQPNLYRKGIQSPAPDIVSFIQHELQGSGWFMHWIPSNAAEVYQKSIECFRNNCCTSNERPSSCWC